MLTFLILRVKLIVILQQKTVNYGCKLFIAKQNLLFLTFSDKN